MLLKIYRNIFLVAFVILITNQPIVAQGTALLKGTMNVGFEAGIQFTGVDDPYVVIADAGIGYVAGPFFEYYLSNIIKFRVGLNFDNRAFSLQDMNYIVGDSGYVGKSSYYDVYEKFKVNYLTIPLSLIYIKGSDKFKFFIQGTVYYSLLLNTIQTGYADVYISEEDANNFYFEGYPELNIPGHHYFDPELQVFSTSDIGINLLFGFLYNIKPNLGISISPGFSYSFANVWEDPSRRATWSQLYKINVGLVYTLK